MQPEHDLPVPIEVLYGILQIQRPAWSAGEHAFIANYLDTIEGMEADTFGNRWITTNSKSRTLFSAHTDTVHPKHEKDFAQTLLIDEVGTLTAEGKQQLGADNGVGCWILMNMIAANVPGTYVFHRAEEVGGTGSIFIAKHQPQLLKNFDRAIAFDRKGTSSVITHQSMERGCSDTFATALCDALGMGHQLDDGGTFTDTRNYFDLIPECTNVSAGYALEHTFNESLNTIYAVALAKRCIEVSWEQLPVARDPAVAEYLDYGNYGYSNYGYSNYGYGNYNPKTDRFRGNSRNMAAWTDKEWDDYLEAKETKISKTTPARQPDLNELDDLVPDIYELVYHYHQEVAEWLDEHGVTEIDLWREIQEKVQWSRTREGNK